MNLLKITLLYYYRGVLMVEMKNYCLSNTTF